MHGAGDKGFLNRSSLLSSSSGITIEPARNYYVVNIDAVRVTHEIVAIN